MRCRLEALKNFSRFALSADETAVPALTLEGNSLI
jgi:hypothetical protein